MSEVSLTTRLKRMLNKCLPAAWAAKLGDRLYEMESYGVLAHSYANGHAAKTYAFADLPIAPIVRITLTLADAAADLVLPAATNKVYIINNTSGQTITVKCADQTGTALANNGRYVCWSNGTDIITSVPEVTLAGAQTLTNKTLTSPALNTPIVASPDITFHSVAHDYAGAAEDWTLNATELKAFILKPTNANGAVNAIVADTANKVYAVVNGTGKTLTVKTAAGTGIAIANGKAAMVMSDGTNVIRVTPDA